MEQSKPYKNTESLGKSRVKLVIITLEVVIALALLISLISHSPEDPSIFNTGNIKGNISNILGALGAHISDILIESFGMTTSVIITFFICMYHQYISERDGINLTLLRLSCFTLFVPLMSVSISLMLRSYEGSSYISAGGFIGYVISEDIMYNILYNSLPKKFTIYSILSLTSSLFIFIFRIPYLAMRLSKIITNKARDKIAEKKRKQFYASVAEPEEDEGTEFEDYEEHEQYDEQQYGDRPLEKEKVKQETDKKSTSLFNVSKDNSNNNRDFRTNKPKCNNRNAIIPPISFIEKYEEMRNSQSSKEELQAIAQKLLKVLGDFGIKGKIEHMNQGPVVTLYELEPVSGTKSSRVIGLADDIARSMMALTARINVIPGKNALGIELPNSEREIFSIREHLRHPDYLNSRDGIPLILGKSVSGEIIVANLTKMPHLLVAGTTGSGKSVAINAMILSIIYKFTPDECKLIMIDPKMLELSVYEGIPHLITPVVTDPKKSVPVLKWLTQEMEERYKAMSILGVRNITSYNHQIRKAKENSEIITKSIQVGFDPETKKPIFENIDMSDKPLPYIVVIVEEMADLILVAGKDVESYIQRLAQMARAAGIHLIMATQRPSVDVITGVIKANFPTRISFQVTSKIDSRTILGETGAEQLLGMGDMLYMKAGGQIERVHGPLVTAEEVIRTVEFLKSKAAAEYTISPSDLVDMEQDLEGQKGYQDDKGDDKDELYDEAVSIVMRDNKVSTSYIQRRLKIGYNRASLIVERMEDEGIVGPPSATGKRHILKNEKTS